MFKLFTAIYIGIGGSLLGGFLALLFFLAGGFASDSGSKEALDASHSFVVVGEIVGIVCLVLSMIVGYLIWKNSRKGWVLGVIFSSVIFLLVAFLEIKSTRFSLVLTIATLLPVIFCIKGLKDLNSKQTKPR